MTHSDQFLRQRKFMVVLPLLVTPFVTMLFWALGGGQTIPSQASADPLSGINMRLPEAYFDEAQKMDKFSLYEQASEDSVKVEDAAETESYFNVDLIKDKSSSGDTGKENHHSKRVGTLDLGPNAIDPNEKKVNDKLERLYKVLNAPPAMMTTPATPVRPMPEPVDSSFHNEVGKLEQMMNVMGKGEEDPEIKQMSAVLDKILEIQHPERASKQTEGDSEPTTFAVKPSAPGTDVSEIQNGILPTQAEASSDSTSLSQEQRAREITVNHFYSDEEDYAESPVQSNAIQAVIHGNQEVVAGSTVKLRLVSDVTINGQLIPQGHFVYGTCSLNEERLSIAITSIRNSNMLLPVSLQVYDLDGLQGIYIPGATTRDAAKQASSQSLQGLQLMSMDNSLGMQAATAGVESAKSLLTKKAKLIKVNLKAGYQVLLKDKDAQPPVVQATK